MTQDSSPIRAFFAYPSRPPGLVETIRNAIEMMNNQLPSVRCQSWEEARVAGKVVIQEITERIDAAQLVLADMTGLNPNVMFEVGYAIGRNKRIWPLLDNTMPGAKRDYERMQLLRGIGYVGYSNSRNILTSFMTTSPFTDLSDTIYARTIEPQLAPGGQSPLLYLRLNHETEAERHISELVQRFQRMGVSTIIDDPNEARVEPLAWYGQKAYSALGILAHFSSPKRDGWEAHNARYAFICGLGHGFGVPILMLAEADYEAPLDYQHLMLIYKTARECQDHARRFLEQVRASHRVPARTPQLELRSRALAIELKALRLGEHIAEHEADQLDDYFIETAAFDEAVRGRFTVFVGRKGSGKTANLIRLASSLGGDPRSLVVLVKPLGYDLDGVIRLLRKYREKDTKGYLVESLWKFLLFTEMARSSIEKIERRPVGVWTPAESVLVSLVNEKYPLVRESFPVRLERCVEGILSVPESESLEVTRGAISEALHTGPLGELRRAIRQVLGDRTRVALLVDNLDKSWTRNGEMEELSALFLGLLGTARRLPVEFIKSGQDRKLVNVTLTVFVRSDIFQSVLNYAREPDKIPYTTIKWDDPQMLFRVIEQDSLLPKADEHRHPISGRLTSVHPFTIFRREST
jgi:hypothetical protein